MQLADDKIPHIENPKDTIRKLLEVTSEFRKSQDTKSIHRNHLHFYILTMKNQEEKLSNESPFTIATKRIKYLGINLPKETKDLYMENYKTRRSNQSILKDTSPGCSLKGLMLRLKLKYFGHLMRRVDSLEKTLMLVGIGGRRRRG